tara:strand:+ start:1433 stop:1765 length:333 start_codon:yes stop_codon:yes gene_type:complete
MIGKAVTKIIFTLAMIGILVYMIFAMAELSAQNKQLIQVMAKMQQSWLNSNEITIESLEKTENIKQIYSKNFYKVLSEIRDDDEGILEMKTPDSIKKYLQLPPKGIDVYD